MILYKLYFRVFFILLVFGSTAVLAKELSIQECKDLSKTISSNASLSLIERKNLWEKNKEQCSWNGLYQFYLMDYYVAMNDYTEAKIIADSILKDEKKFDSSISKVILSYSINLDMMNPDLHQQAREKIYRLMKEYEDLYEGYALMGFLSMSENKFEDAKNWYLKAIKETEEPEKLARVYAGLSSAYFYLKKSDREVLETFKKSWDLDRGRALLDDRACRAAVFILLSQDKINDSKYILTMQKKYIHSIEENINYIEAKEAVAQYENKLKRTVKRE